MQKWIIHLHEMSAGFTNAQIGMILGGSVILGIYWLIKKIKGSFCEKDKN